MKLETRLEINEDDEPVVAFYNITWRGREFVKFAVDDVEIFCANPDTLADIGDVAKQAEQALRRAQDAVVLALGEDEPARRRARGLEDRLHQHGRAEDRGVEPRAVALELALDPRRALEPLDPGLLLAVQKFLQASMRAFEVV